MRPDLPATSIVNCEEVECETDGYEKREPNDYAGLLPHTQRQIDRSSTHMMGGFVISWIQSYLFSRSSFVKIDSSSSPITTILTGVPQGSVLGPLLFVLFISPIANVINPGQACNNLVSFHQYADDTQLYIGANSSLPSQIASIESCTLRVHDWLLNNGVHLNPSKSEAIAFLNPRSKPLPSLAESVESISVALSPIKLHTSIQNLGVYLDSRLSFDKQVSETCKTSYFHIRALRQHHIQSSLTAEAAKKVATAIVGSRLDYCNSLLAGTSVSNLSRLQLVQNNRARVVVQKTRFDHITPVLSELHWLPVRHRINFKIVAAITHMVLQSQQPSYLAALIPHYAPVRSLRSSSFLSICVPLRKTSMAASRSFSSVAPKIWNALPGHLSSIPTLPAFRRALKHHFFLSAYPDSRTFGGIKPSERITLRDTTPPAAIVLIKKYYAVQLNALHLSACD